MFTTPEDLPEGAIADALRDRWGFTPQALDYQPVGFGSHHWLATHAGGTRVFATVDDLADKLRTPDDTTDAAFGRLQRAFGTARSLRDEAGLAFVIAPTRTTDGQVLARLSDRYSLAIHPYITGTAAGQDGEFTSRDDQRAVLGMLVQLHDAHTGEPPS